MLQCVAAALGASAALNLPDAHAKPSAGDWSTPGLAQPDDVQEKFFKLENGTKVQQLVGGSGTAAGAGDRVLIDYVLRRNNGYFIYSCASCSSCCCRCCLVSITSSIWRTAFVWWAWLMFGATRKAHVHAIRCLWRVAWLQLVHFSGQCHP